MTMWSRVEKETIRFALLSVQAHKMQNETMKPKKNAKRRKNE